MTEETFKTLETYSFVGLAVLAAIVAGVSEMRTGAIFGIAFLFWLLLCGGMKIMVDATEKQEAIRRGRDQSRRD